MKLQRSNRRNHALTLIEVLVVIALLFLLAAMILPHLAGSQRSPRIACVNNLKQIGLSYQIWKGDNGNYPMDVSVTNGGTMEIFSKGSPFQNFVFLNFLIMSNELSTPKILHCPCDSNSSAATNFSSDFGNRNVSYFVNLDMNNSNPKTLFSGDDNFEISSVPVKSGSLQITTNTLIAWSALRHKFAGNISLADGSVQMLKNSDLPNQISRTGLATNRLAIP
jgi:prepilin-type processing-associated H-X9-DG protein